MHFHSKNWVIQIDTKNDLLSISHILLYGKIYNVHAEGPIRFLKFCVCFIGQQGTGKENVLCRH